jgi:predicted ArsR family transcriptional regulator
MGTRRRQATEAEAKAMASGVRLRIIRLCLDQTLTNKEIAERLGANPATTLHHVRTLVSTGFLVADDVRRGSRGSREVPYRSTGKSWTLDVRDTPGGANQAMLDAFHDELGLVDLDNVAQADFARLGLRLDAADLAVLKQRLEELLDEYQQRPLSPGGEAVSIFVAVYADVARSARPAGSVRSPAASSSTRRPPGSPSPR